MRFLAVSAMAAALVVACSKGTSTQVPAGGVLPTGSAGRSERGRGPAPSGDASTFASARPGPPRECNVILLSIDSLRADMPWNGYARPIAPRLTELERRSVSYSRAYSVSSYTSMSLGGLLAGRLPSELVRSGYFFGTYRNDLFFPKLLERANVWTMGVMAHTYFRSAGFDDGFADWRIVPGITFDPNTDRDVTSPQHEKIAEEMLGDPANETRRFFFWAHFLDPHDLYIQHPGIDWGNRPRDRYDGEVEFADRYLGKLLDFIATKSWAARTVVIVTADHGEEFGEHGMTRHGFEVWETLVHVPLMFVAPGASPRRVDAMRSAIDLAPTILELFGVPADPAFEGKSLVGEIYGAPAEDRDVVVDLPATSDSGRRRALLHEHEKLICADNDTACRVFDLSADPGEKSPAIRGNEYVEMKRLYDTAAKGIKEVTPYACASDCLNGAYKKKQDGGQ